MELLRLVIVDDEPILLQGLVHTYDWAAMGYEVVGSAQSGEQAIEVIAEKKPHVVLTDIRMKQITGLMVMEEIQKRNMDCIFVVLSAYRDFEYAQQACDLGAFAYLLKPLEEDKLWETMHNAYLTCMEQLRNEEKYDNWERLLVKDSTSFLQVAVQKYIQDEIPEQKMEEILSTLQKNLEEKDRFISVCVGIDLAFKITNAQEYEVFRLTMIARLEEELGKKYFFWKLEDKNGNYTFVIKTQENATVRALKQILETQKKALEIPVLTSISKPYKGIAGIRRSFWEAQELFDTLGTSGDGTFRFPEERAEDTEEADAEVLIVNAVRRNQLQELKDAFIRFIYQLPQEEELQCQYLHKVMLKTEFMVKDSYGMTEELRRQFQNYYSNISQLDGARAVDVCYKILRSVIERRKEDESQEDGRHVKEYMSVAVAYIEEHLNDEELSIVSVAAYVYLNPVYFGRVFKNTFHMTFKKYVLQQRMERAKKLMEEGRTSIGNICEQVGINNPSYFSHLFKQYTGKLPTEYKREYDL